MNRQCPHCVRETRGGKLSAGNVMIGDATWAVGTTTRDLAIQGNVGIAPPFWSSLCREKADLLETRIMYYIYVLKSVRYDFIYVGSTPDLKKRFFEHNTGKNQSTKHYAPFKLVYYEAYADKNDALDREHKLKHHGSVIGHLKKRLKNSLNK